MEHVSSLSGEVYVTEEPSRQSDRSSTAPNRQ
jgi:hypothetical protein